MWFNPQGLALPAIAVLFIVMASSDEIVSEFMLHDFFLTSIDGAALCEGNRNKLPAVLPGVAVLKN